MLKMLVMNSAQAMKIQATRPLDSAGIDVLDGDAQISLISFIPELLRSLHCDPMPVLNNIGIDPLLFNDSSATVSFSKACMLMDACSQASGAPHFGLLMGERFTLPLLGVVEQLMCYSNTVHEAILQLIRHQQINDRGAVVYLIEYNHDEVALGYSVFTNKLPGLTQLFDYSMSNAYTILQHLCGAAWRPKRVTFAHSAPQNLTPYQNQFNAPLYFDATRTEIVFSRHWLDALLKSANNTQRMLSERIAFGLENDNEEVFVQTVRRTIQTMLLSGDASAAQVCKQLRIHERILRRRLQKEGTSIKWLKTKIRFNLACQLLGTTKLSLSEIAAHLGYSDATAFSRAFQQQANIAPATWRKQYYEQSIRELKIK